MGHDTLHNWIFLYELESGWEIFLDATSNVNLEKWVRDNPFLGTLEQARAESYQRKKLFSLLTGKLVRKETIIPICCNIQPISFIPALYQVELERRKSK